MGYVLRPDRRLERELRRVATERLDGAVEQLDRAIDHDDLGDVGGGSSDVDLESIVHDVRKRCKATRGLARLVEPAVGDEFRPFDRTVRKAANELSTLRDAHALIGTFDMLLTVWPDDAVLQDMRRRHIEMTDTASRDVRSDGDARLETARALLADAADMSRRWKFGRDVDVLESGIAATYRQGRSSLRRVRSKPTDHRLHEWRKAVKYLWYQMQLVHDAAPSVLGPLVDELDRLSEALGNDHDLAVLVELLDAGRGDAHAAAEADHVCTIAREHQAVLRERALRVGATLYAEADDAFADRIARYWRLAVDLGPEPAADETVEPVEQARSLVERERKFLIDEPPPHVFDADAVTFRQGYLFSDGRGSIRVRDAGPAGCTLTFKAGGGAERTELEWSIDRREFDAAWPYTNGHRVEKTRRRIADGDRVIELDVFGGDLDGLVLAEVEFESTETMEAFEPPSWFGREVTDDPRYANVELARSGLPSDTDGTTGV